MMKFLYINFIVSLWLTSLATFSLGVFVLIRNYRNIINKTFAFYSFSISWWSFCQVWLIACDKRLTALIWTRIEQVGVFFIPTLFVHFVISLLNIKEKKWLLKVAYTLSVLFAFLCATKYMMADVIPKSSVPYVKYFATSGLAYHFAILFFVIMVIYGLNKLYDTYRLSTGARRNQLKYLLWSSFFGYVGGGANFFLVYGISIPFLNPFGTYAVAIYIIVVAYAILQHRLMDIDIVLTRVGIFAVVYTLVLGIPFWVGFKFLGKGLWILPVSITAVFATLGPFIFTYLRRQAEARLRSEEHRARQLLTQASEGMMRIRSIKRLVNLIVHVPCKTLKLHNAAVFLLDEAKGEYKLEAVRLRSRYQYLDSLDNKNVLVQRLSQIKEPLVYEEIKLEVRQIKDKVNDPTCKIESQMQKLSAAVIIPAISRGRLLGFLVLGEKNSKRMYSSDDLAVLWAISYQAALAIENAQFHKKLQEQLLKEDREMTSRFIGQGASHQFGNLLNRLVMRSSGKEMDLEELDLNNLSKEDLRKIILELKEEFKAITSTALQGKDIVSGILSMGSDSPVEFKQEDLASIVIRAVETTKLKQSKAGIQSMTYITEITIKITHSLPKIYCNRLQIEQVLDNMLDNSLEAIEEKNHLIKRGELKEDNFRGKVILEAGKGKDHLYLKLQDNGIGIKPADQRKLFTPFFTTKATERLSRKGHGIGMHVVENIIRAHQGKIYLDSTEYGKGTTFVMEFPLKISENRKT